MTTKLKLYNGALRALGQTPLASLEENQKSRRLLDAAWDQDALRYCLEQGQWNFAGRTAKFTYSSSLEPAFGHSRVFEKPADWVNTGKLCSDERLISPILDYRDEGGNWFADIDTIYVHYISSDASYGGDLSIWPETFTQFVRYYLAQEICIDLTQSETRFEKIQKDLRDLRTDARSKDAMNQPPMFMQEGRFVRARRGGNSRHDRTGGSLIG